MNKLELVLREYGGAAAVEVIRPHDGSVLTLKILTTPELDFRGTMDKLTEVAKALSFEVPGLGPHHMMGDDKGPYYVFYMDFDAE